MPSPKTMASPSLRRSTRPIWCTASASSIRRFFCERLKSPMNRLCRIGHYYTTKSPTSIELMGGSTIGNVFSTLDCVRFFRHKRPEAVGVLQVEGVNVNTVRRFETIFADTPYEITKRRCGFHQC